MSAVFFVDQIQADVLEMLTPVPVLSVVPICAINISSPTVIMTQVAIRITQSSRRRTGYISQMMQLQWFGGTKQVHTR